MARILGLRYTDKGKLPLKQINQDEFLKYQEQIHAFLPLRKFKG